MYRTRGLIISACFAAAATAALAGGCQSTTPPIPRPPAPAAAAYDLRGTPVRGATTRSEMDLLLKDASLKFEGGGLALAGVVTWHLATVDELQIFDVADGMVRKGRLAHVLDRFDSSMRVTLPDGTPEDRNESENGVLHGRSETIENVSGTWRRTLEGTPPTPEQQRELDRPPLDDETYPTAVHVGESWTQRGPELRRWLGADFVTVGGEVKNTLLAVDVVNGERVARIESIGEVNGTMLGDDSTPMEVGMGLRSTIRRSLDRAIDLDGSGEGAMTVKTTFVDDDGTSVTFSASGRYTLRVAGSVR